MLTEVPAYDDFAWFYDRYWNEEFHSLAFPILERIWLPRVPANGRILDVCCGTGYLAGLLVDRGYRLSGVDVSGPMIAYAREHVPSADFHVADVAAFRSEQQFDAAVSTFDSLNHMLTAEDLRRVIEGVRRALEPGGLYVFDMNL